ncbi:unnamed protein product, partial [Oikopleura dioica]
MESIFSELARLFDAIKKNERDEILDSTKILRIQLKQTQNSGDFGAEKLAFIYNKPFQAIIKQNAPSSTIVLDSVEFYTSLIQKCVFKSPIEIVPHFSWIPNFSQKIGEKDETILETLSSFLKHLFSIKCPDTVTYRKYLNDEKAKNFLSAVIFHTISVGKKAPTKMILNNCVSVISTIATKENPKLIESIFPGLFTFIAKTMMKPANLSSTQFLSWLKLLRTVVITFLHSFPAENLDENHIEAISKAIRPLLSKIVGFKNGLILAEASSMSNEIFPLIENLQYDLFDLLSYSRTYEEVDKEDIFIVPKKERIQKSSDYLELFGTIFSKGNFSFILRCNAGLLESLTSSELSLILNVQSFISKLLNNLEPDFSTLPPIVVTEVRNLREHEESYAQKDANEKSVSIELAKFTPKTFSEQDLAILKRILKKILGDFSFQGEIFDS